MVSDLPQHILHHILRYLSQKEAVQTCVLSKSWRHLGPTRPKIEFLEACFGGDNKTLMSSMDNTLQRYHDDKLSIQDFILVMSVFGSESISFLEKWISLLMLRFGVNKFDLSVFVVDSDYLHLPPVVFESETLQTLSLFRCKLNHESIHKVTCRKLRRLHLTRVYIADETLEKILSSCPLMEHVVFYLCDGLTTIKMNKPRNLKYFEFRGRKDEHSIEIDIPTLETYKIERCSNWFHDRQCFPRLKSLYLKAVQLSQKSFDSFSCDFPCLEKLRLTDCYGFEEFKLVSRSIKFLTIEEGMETPVKAAIDAPNIVKFEYQGRVPQSISFKTTSSEWKSKIAVSTLVYPDDDVPSWFLELYETLKALSESEISLRISRYLIGDAHIEDDLPRVLQDAYGCFVEPVVVEHLHLKLSGYSLSASSAFMNDFFRICRPRNISPLYSDTMHEGEWEHTLLLKILVMKRENREYFWQQDLEQVIVEVFDKNEKQCYPVRETSSTKYAALWPDYDDDDEDKQEFCFRLKWRES